MDRAVALPENDFCFAQGSRSVAAEFLEGIPDDHFAERNAHAIASVAPKMFIRQEENLFAALKSPFHNGGCVGTGADRTAMLAGEGFNRGGGIHVGDGNDLICVQNACEFAPAGFDLPDVGHIRHGAAGAEIGENDDLLVAAENIRALGHEVNAAKNDVLAFGFGGLLGELERIATKIGELHNFVALVMVAENYYVSAKSGLGCGDAVVERGIGHQEVGIEVAAHALFDFRRADSHGLFCARERIPGDEGKGSHGSISALSATFRSLAKLVEFLRVLVSFTTKTKRVGQPRASAPCCLASDEDHGPRGRHEARLVDAVTFFLFHHDGTDPVDNRFVG